MDVPGEHAHLGEVHRLLPARRGNGPRERRHADGDALHGGVHRPDPDAGPRQDEPGRHLDGGPPAPALLSRPRRQGGPAPLSPVRHGAERLLHPPSLGAQGVPEADVRPRRGSGHRALPEPGPGAAGRPPALPQVEPDHLPLRAGGGAADPRVGAARKDGPHLQRHGDRVRARRRGAVPYDGGGTSSRPIRGPRELDLEARNLMETPTSTRPQSLEHLEALCRSLMASALALGFEPPEEKTLEALFDPRASRTLVDAAAFLDEQRGTCLAERVLAMGEHAPTLEELAVSHARLFGHTARGPACPYETEYGENDLFLKPQELSDIAGFLRAFGLVLDPSRHERIDHVSCELEFASFLARKEAAAIEVGDGEMRAECQKATRLFLKDHLGRFAPSFASKVKTMDGEGPYGKLADLLFSWVASEAASTGVSTGPPALRLRAMIDDGAPMACGSEEACGTESCGEVAGIGSRCDAPAHEPFEEPKTERSV